MKLKRQCRDERGETLIEIIVAIGVLSIAVAALLGALITSLGSSAEHRSLSTVDTVLRSYAETAKFDIQLQPHPWYQDCAGVTSSPPAYGSHALTAQNVPTGWSQPWIVGITYWNISSGAFDTLCQSGDYQLLTLAVGAPDGSTKTVTIGLRSPT